MGQGCAGWASRPAGCVARRWPRPPPLAAQMMPKLMESLVLVLALALEAASGSGSGPGPGSRR